MALVLVASQSWGVMTLVQEVYLGQRDPADVLEEMTAIAEVVRNRVESGYASDGSIEGTVMRPLQFSGWNSHDPNRVRVAKMAAKGHSIFELAGQAWHRAWVERTQVAKGAVLYHARSMTTKPPWTARVTLVATVGQHVFYKDP